MSFSTSISINTVITLISVSLENVIENLTTFSDLVEDLFNHVSLLSSEQHRFLSSLIRFRAQLRSTLPIIRELENDLTQLRQQLRNLVKKGMVLNESNINHVLILEALQNEKNLLRMDTTTDSVEIEKQKKKIRAKIQENIAEMLQKKRSQNTCKLELKCVLEKIAYLMSQMEVVEAFKESIGRWWVRSVEDGNRL